MKARTDNLFILKILIIVLFVSSNKSFAQTKDTTFFYNYVNNEHILTFSTIKRIYEKNPMYFTDYRVLKDSMQIDYAWKIVDGSWFFKHDNKWVLLFDKNLKKQGYLFIYNKMYKVSWRDTKFRDNNEPIYHMRVETGDDFNDEKDESYFFTKKDGIIAIKSGHYFLIRWDKKNIDAFSDENYIKFRFPNWYRSN